MARFIVLEGSAVTLIRVLVVDDHEYWRKFASTTLQKRPESKVIGEASDGLQAIQLAEQLQPDLIVLDVGLPDLNGIEAARTIRKLCPNSKIAFMTANRSRDIAEEALSTGARAYVVKSDAASELLPAIKAVLEGKRFLSASLDLTSNDQHAKNKYSDVTAPLLKTGEVQC